MIIVTKLKQNEEYNITTDLLEFQDVFIERVENTVNDIVSETNGKLINIQYLTNEDRSLTCIFSVEVDKKSYDRYYNDWN